MKRTEQVGRVEVSSDGKTVWINGSNGWLVGRFSATGMDFNKTSSLQDKAGPMTGDDWVWFCAQMLDVHGVEISKQHTPDFLKVPA